MKKAEQRQAVLFTMDGVFPAWSVHLYCTGDFHCSAPRPYILTSLFTVDCKMNYHHNFYVEGGQRVYYNIAMDIIQVGEHQFVERKVINLFITLMLVSWYVHSVYPSEHVPKEISGHLQPIALACTTLPSQRDTRLPPIGPSILNSPQIMYMTDS